MFSLRLCTRPCVFNSTQCFAPNVISTQYYRYAINGSFLDNGIVSHKHAWFWGMFLTDGTMMHRNGQFVGLRWGLRYSCYPMLQGLKRAVDSTHIITFDMWGNQSGNTYPICELRLHNTRLADQACALLRCNPRRKTYDLKFPPDIDSQFYSSLLRGIYDGDG